MTERVTLRHIKIRIEDAMQVLLQFAPPATDPRQRDWEFIVASLENAALALHVRSDAPLAEMPLTAAGRQGHLSTGSVPGAGF